MYPSLSTSTKNKTSSIETTDWETTFCLSTLIELVFAAVFSIAFYRFVVCSGRVDRSEWLNRYMNSGIKINVQQSEKLMNDWLEGKFCRNYWNWIEKLPILSEFWQSSSMRFASRLEDGLRVIFWIARLHFGERTRKREDESGVQYRNRSSRISVVSSAASAVQYPGFFITSHDNRLG